MTRPSIVFDCDGVLLDSNAMKNEAFAIVLSDYPADVVGLFLAYQGRSFGRSRFLLIEDFFRDFLKRDPEPGKIDALIKAFGNHTAGAYLDVAEVTDLRETLETLAKDYTLFVASGSAQDELRGVFEKRSLDSHFAGIFGSPTRKADILTTLAQDHDIAAMIGDAKADFDAAEAAGVRFVYASDMASAPEQMAELAAEHGFDQIATIAELPKLLSDTRIGA